MRHLKFAICLYMAVCGSVVVGVCVGDESSRSDLLDGSQALYIKWSDDNFGHLTNRSSLMQLSPKTRNELIGLWRNKLDLLINEGHVNRTEVYGVEDFEKWEAINCLGALQAISAQDLLLKIATEPVAKDNRERWMAVRALGKLGDLSIVPKLMPLLSHYNQNTRFWTQITLCRLTGKNLGPSYSKWVKQWHETHPDVAIPADAPIWPIPNGAPASWQDADAQSREDQEFSRRLLEGEVRVRW